MRDSRFPKPAKCTPKPAKPEHTINAYLYYLVIYTYQAPAFPFHGNFSILELKVFPKKVVNNLGAVPDEEDVCKTIGYLLKKLNQDQDVLCLIIAEPRTIYMRLLMFARQYSSDHRPNRTPTQSAPNWHTQARSSLTRGNLRTWFAYIHVGGKPRSCTLYTGHDKMIKGYMTQDWHCLRRLPWRGTLTWTHCQFPAVSGSLHPQTKVSIAQRMRYLQFDMYWLVIGFAWLWCHFQSRPK